jgi:pyrroloquinoline-quinone synthase
MTTARASLQGAFWNELEQRIAKYDLLCHPFYKAWSAGELTHQDLREYSADYYHHVAAFPTYLSALHSRLEDGELRREVLRNLCDEEIEGTSHTDLWLNFSEGFGATRDSVRQGEAVDEVKALIATFRQIAANGSPAEALAMFYAYESQVPRVAKEKAIGLKNLYGADAKTCGYFKLHQTADVHHSNVWRVQLDQLIASDPQTAHQALDAAETAAEALWQALDGIERSRTTRAAIAPRVQ